MLNPFRYFRRADPPPAAPPAATATAPPPERRASLENPATPVTAEQLASIIGYGPTRSGVQIDERSAMSVVAVLACVRILAESIGMLPMAVFRGDEDGLTRERATDHPAYALLRWRPNAEMTPAVFRETLMGHLGLWNNAYARIVLNASQEPIALLPLDPSRTRAERVAGRPQYVVTGGGGRFDPAEVLHVRGLGFDGLNGYKTVGLVREAIALAKSQELYGATFFGSGGNVGGIITFEQTMRPEQRLAWREEWNRAYAGLTAAHATALLDGGAKYTRIGTAPEEGQMLESRKFQLLEIARHYRVPPHMLGDMTQGTGRNIEQLSLEFLTYTLGPWLTKFEEEFKVKLCGDGEDYHVRFDERRLLRTDLEARKNYYSTSIQWGWMNPAEVRREEGMPPAGPELDVYVRPVNMAPATAAGAAPPLAAQSAATPPTPASARALVPVFADAIGRMLRKEQHALSRGMTPEKADRFYAEHRAHVREAMAAPVGALSAVAGLGGRPRHEAAVEEVASERHVWPADVDLTAVATAKAESLVRTLLSGGPASEQRAGGGQPREEDGRFAEGGGPATPTKEAAGRQFAERFNARAGALRQDANEKAKAIAAAAKSKFRELRVANKSAPPDQRRPREAHAKQAAEHAVAPHSGGWDRPTHESLVDSLAADLDAGHVAINAAHVRESAAHYRRDGEDTHHVNPLDPTSHPTLAAAKAHASPPVQHAWEAELANVHEDHREYVGRKAGAGQYTGRVNPAKFATGRRTSDAWELRYSDAQPREKDGKFGSSGGGGGGGGGGGKPTVAQVEAKHGKPKGNWQTPTELPGPNKGVLPPAKKFVAPPEPKGKSAAGGKAGGYSASGMSNTHLGDLAEKVLGEKGGFTSILPPGQRQNPLDVRWDHGDQAFEVKATSTSAKEYKSAPKGKEVGDKLAYAKQYGYKPNLIVAVVDHDKGELHAYMKTGTVVGSLHKGGTAYGESSGWKFLGTHSFSKADVEATRPKSEKAA